MGSKYPSMITGVPTPTKESILVLADGSTFYGTSFGYEGSVSGECVFQTGMAGYTESLTDPSYEGQILVLTYPLIGNYGVPKRTIQELNSLPEMFESSRIHVAALVVAYYSDHFSHFLANSSLGAWLKESRIPAMYGVDTRVLTKKIRENGSMLGKVLTKREDLPHPDDGNLALSVNHFSSSGSGSGSRTPSPTLGNQSWIEEYVDVPFVNPNVQNLVAGVSVAVPKLYLPTSSSPRLHPSAQRNIRVIAIDLGMKYNQIRCFIRRGVELKVVPWNYNYLTESEDSFDGLFISNGPGDPTVMSETISHLRLDLQKMSRPKPIFGICLGHQLLALAAGASTSKMKYGNRGQNIPCTDSITGRCYITSQNHGFQVNADSLPSGWTELYKNANDESNEGIYHTSLPYFSVQFHPESTPGPRDTEFLFDVFIDKIEETLRTGELTPISTIRKPSLSNGVVANEPTKKPSGGTPRKVMILGSGGLSIGQAGEFDYSGSQAIKALKEEGIYTIFVNPNIATIATSKGLADKVYFLPVTPDFVRRIIRYEHPDGIYVTFGGQTALNVGIKLRDEFESLGVRVLGTPIDTIIKTEDRDLFSQAMAEIGERCAESASATTFEEASEAAQRIGYPVIVRAAYALGGLGSGFAEGEEGLKRLCATAFATSPQVLVEKSMKGWKEIEYEVVRDCNDNCITVCNMENFDPLGIHTGDSIVVAPSQTLSDADYNMLRTTAVNVIRHLGVVGECNIQYALNPFSTEYCIIEVNARLSRSSALASKATGYPLAFIAAKLGLGIPLNGIKNTVTKLTTACFEPSLDYVVVKFPRWDLKKFSRVSKQLSSSMKSVGEVMAIGRTFEESIQKAIRAIDDQFVGFDLNDFASDIDAELSNPTDKRMFAIAAAFREGYTVDQVWKLTNIGKWFLTKLYGLHDFHEYLRGKSPSMITTDCLRTAKRQGFSDRQIARALNTTELAIRQLRKEAKICPFVKQIDTVAAEFPAFTNYLYTTYNGTEHDVEFSDHGVMVLGSGVYRIGSSVEFDWCAVRAIRTLRDQGLKTVMVNYNPETVSTDYDEADRLYFDNISLETVLDICDLEGSSGVIISMGGQTPNNIALPLYRQNVHIYGTSPEMIDTCENRYNFSRLLDKIGVDQPLWKELSDFASAQAFCNHVGYPVLVRPSYVLSGAAMNVVSTEDDLSNYLHQATAVSREHPVVISKYIEEAKEIEMDAIAKNGKLVMHYISEHIENAGVHSGDATLVLPPQDLDPETVRRIEDATRKIGNALNVTGPFNIQFIAKNNDIKVIECNLRAARSFPFVSKVTGIDAVEMATMVMLDLPIVPYPDLNLPPDYVGVKVPQFSFNRLSGADPVLGVEMASTGEVACFGKNKYEAYLKALVSTGIVLPKKNILLSIGSFKEKMEMLPSVQKLHQAGYNLLGTAGTADFFTEHNIPCKYLEALPEGGSHSQKSEYSLTQHLANNMIDLYINLPSKNNYRRPATYTSKGYRTRRMAVDFAVPLITNVKIAKLLAEALVRKMSLDVSPIDFKTSHTTFSLPGLINVQAFVPRMMRQGSSDFEHMTKASVSAGFTTVQIMPFDVEGSLTSGSSLDVIRHNINGAAYCNYALSIAASATNASTLDEELQEEAKALFIPFNGLSDQNISKVAAVAAHFAAWPKEKPIITDARATDLATILLLASLHNRSVHVTDVGSREDIQLITLSKEKGLKVTCDVSVYSMFFTRERYPASTHLPTPTDQQALWNHLDSIDIFAVGTAPYRLALDLGKPVGPQSGIEETLPLLLTAQSEGRLTMDDIRAKLHDNPLKIFELPAQANSQVEVEMNRKNIYATQDPHWSPLQGAAVNGYVHRVILQGQTVYLDGLNSATPIGRDVSSLQVMPIQRTSGRTGSFVGPIRPAVQPDQLVSPTLMSSARNVDAPQPLHLYTRDISPNRLMTLPPHPAFHRRSILSVKQFTHLDIHHLFDLAHEMRLQVERNGVIDVLRGRVLCNVFYEPSTRTSSSFETAMKRLGGEVVSITADQSSVAKGESLADTIRTLACYGDAIVLRHPTLGSVASAAKFSSVPIINAGDGVGEHPTQALLDVFTIRSELGTVNGKSITLLGDLKNGRTVHSLVTLLCFYSVRLNFVSPPELTMPDTVVASARRAGINVTETNSLNEVLSETDVLYVTRVQQERFTDLGEWERVRKSYVVDHSVLARAKTDMIVMHPLPRLAEIDPEVDFDSRRAVYFRQMRYGLFVRMALLAMVMG